MLQTTSSSGFHGVVSMPDGRFHAHPRIDGERRSLGMYDHAESAASAIVTYIRQHPQQGSRKAQPIVKLASFPKAIDAARAIIATSDQGCCVLNPQSTCGGDIDA